MGRSTHANSPARRQSILDAALASFTEQGIEGTGIQDICRAAGCSVGTVYHHFKSKEGVWSRLFIDGLKACNADLMEQLRGAGDAETAVRTCVTQYSDWVTAHRELARFLLHSRDIIFSAAARSELKELQRAHFGRIFMLFSPWVRSGEMRLLPPETYFPIVIGPIQDYARHWLSGQLRTPPAEVKQVFADAAWAGVRA